MNGQRYYLVVLTYGTLDTSEEVSARQFTEVRVRFIPEYRRAQNRKVTGRTIVPKDINWVEMKPEE